MEWRGERTKTDCPSRMCAGASTRLSRETWLLYVVLRLGDEPVSEGRLVSYASRKLEKGRIGHRLLTVLVTLELAQSVVTVSGLFFQLAIDEVLVVWALRVKLA